MLNQPDSPAVLGLYVELGQGQECSSKSKQVLSLAEQLSIPLLDYGPDQVEEGCYLLKLGADGLSLEHTGHKQAGGIQVDFTSGAARHRRQFGGGKSQMIAKAVGVKGAYKPSVLDLTAGLGQDSFAIACLGCSVTLVERNPVVFALLSDGLGRARAFAASKNDKELISIIQAMRLHQSNGLDYLAGITERPDVIYLDPMFPPMGKSAKVKKSMQAFHHIVGLDQDSGALLQLALQKAAYRVVVKRPRLAPSLGDQYPNNDLPKVSYTLEGKSSRFDIYTLQKLPLNHFKSEGSA